MRWGPEVKGISCLSKYLIQATLGKSSYSSGLRFSLKEFTWSQNKQKPPKKLSLLFWGSYPVTLHQNFPFLRKEGQFRSPEALTFGREEGLN